MTGDPRPCQCLHCNCGNSANYTVTPVAQRFRIEPLSDEETLDDFAQSALQGLIAAFTEKDREEWQTKFKMSNERIAKQFAHNAYEIAQAMMDRRAALHAAGERGSK